MKSKLPSYAALGVLVLIVFGLSAIALDRYSSLSKAPFSEKPLAFETMAKGGWSEHSEEKNYAITNGNDWQDLWDRMHLSPMVGLPNQPEKPPALPEADFAREIVIASFQGLKSTGGHSIEIAKITEMQNSVEVLVRKVSPGPNCIVTQAFTSPYHIVKIPRTDKEIVFREEQEAAKC